MSTCIFVCPDKAKPNRPLSHVPANPFDFGHVPATPDASQTVVQENRNPPKANIKPAPLTNLALRTPRSTIECARELSSSLRIGADFHPVVARRGGDDLMVLDPNDKWYDTPREVNSFLRYSGSRLQLLSSGFDVHWRPLRLILCPPYLRSAKGGMFSAYRSPEYLFTASAPDLRTGTPRFY